MRIARILVTAAACVVGCSGYPEPPDDPVPCTGDQAFYMSWTFGSETGAFCGSRVGGSGIRFESPRRGYPPVEYSFPATADCSFPPDVLNVWLRLYNVPLETDEIGSLPPDYGIRSGRPYPARLGDGSARHAEVQLGLGTPPEGQCSADTLRETLYSIGGYWHVANGAPGSVSVQIWDVDFDPIGSRSFHIERAYWRVPTVETHLVRAMCEPHCGSP